MSSTGPRGLDDAARTVRERSAAWAALSEANRLDLVERTVVSFRGAASDLVRLACELKGIPLGSPIEGEEWMSGPLPILKNLRALRDDLASRARNGRSSISPSAVKRRHDDSLVVDVLPASFVDRLLFPMTRAEVRLDPSVEPAEGNAPVAELPQDGGVRLVLSAGNVSSIGPLDLLSTLFVDNRTAVVKMHPVADTLRPTLERGFSPLVDAGFLRFVSGGAEEGAYLVGHPDIDEIHITGSETTHDAIVWGSDPETRERNRRAGAPVCDKPVTSELGCITPVLVVPGRWSDRDISYQARNVATAVFINGSFNCNAAKLLVTWKDWPLRQRFLAAIEKELAALPPRDAWYPGSEAKYERFVRSYSQAKPLGVRTSGRLPMTTIFDVDPDGEREIVFREEAWSPILAETALNGDDVAGFLENGVHFLNEAVRGSLSVTILANRATRKILGPRFEDAVDRLRYGSVSVNHWSAFSYAIGIIPWGAFPGNTIEDAESGIGFVHNPYRLDMPTKSVVTGPFRQWPEPGWFVGHRHSHELGRRLIEFEGDRRWSRLPVIGWTAALE